MRRLSGSYWLATASLAFVIVLVSNLILLAEDEITLRKKFTTESHDFLPSDSKESLIPLSSAIQIGSVDAKYNFTESSLDVPLIHFDPLEQAQKKDLNVELAKQISPWLNLRHLERFGYDEFKRFDLGEWQDSNKPGRIDYRSRFEAQLQPKSFVSFTPFIELQNQDSPEIPRSSFHDSMIGLNTQLTPTSTTWLSFETESHIGETGGDSNDGNLRSIQLRQKLFKPLTAVMAVSEAEESSFLTPYSRQITRFGYGFEIQATSSSKVAVGTRTEENVLAQKSAPNITTPSDSTDSFYITWKQELSQGLRLDQSFEILETYHPTTLQESEPTTTWSMEMLPVWKLSDAFSLKAGYRVSSLPSKESVNEEIIEQTTSMGVNLNF